MTFKNVDYCLHGAKEGYIKRVSEREGNREREKREASTNHPLGEGLG